MPELRSRRLEYLIGKRIAHRQCRRSWKMYVSAGFSELVALLKLKLLNSDLMCQGLKVPEPEVPQMHA